MYNRTIALDPAHPERPLEDLCVGLLSAAKITLANVPTAATDVAIVFTSLTQGVPYSYHCTASSGVWSLSIPAGFFNPIGRWRYEVNFTADNGTFWSAAGGLVVTKAAVTGQVPAPIDPTHNKTCVMAVNGVYPDADGKVVVPTDDTDAVRYTSQTLTDLQKAQARTNIGAISSAPVASVNGQTGAVVLNGNNINYEVGTTINEQIDTIGGMAADAGTAAESAAGEIDAHTRDTSNPHGVTAAQVGALTASDVDTALNPSSNNPLANSAVAASLVYDAPDEFTPRVYDEELEGYCYKIKNRKITCVNLTSASADEDWDAVIFRYDGLTFGKSFDAIVFLHCDSSYTAEAFSSGFDATLLMDESLLPTDLEAGSEYVMAITSINSGEVVARIFKKPENGFE